MRGMRCRGAGRVAGFTDVHAEAVGVDPGQGVTAQHSLRPVSLSWLSLRENRHYNPQLWLQDSTQHVQVLLRMLCIALCCVGSERWRLLQRLP